MAYVEAHAALREHPKTKKAARLLDVPPVQVVGHLLFLWWWCQDYAQDGNLSAWTAEDIAEAAGWTKDPDAFVEALIACGRPGFLELDDDDALLIHDWYQYGGKLFTQRKQAAVRQANWRARHRNEPVTPLQDVSNALVTHNVTPSNAYREDKNRIDKSSAQAHPPPRKARPKKEPNPERKEQIWAVAEAIAEVCAIDIKIRDNTAFLCKKAAEIIDGTIPATPELVREHYNGNGWWWREDWRGKKSQRPTPKAITDTWGQWAAVIPEVVPYAAEVWG